MRTLTTKISNAERNSTDFHSLVSELRDLEKEEFKKSLIQAGINDREVNEKPSEEFFERWRSKIDEQKTLHN